MEENRTELNFSNTMNIGARSKWKDHFPLQPDLMCIIEFPWNNGSADVVLEGKIVPQKRVEERYETRSLRAEWYALLHGVVDSESS